MKVKTFIKNNQRFFSNVTFSTLVYIFSAGINYLFNIVLLKGLSGELFGVYSSALGIITLMQIPSLAITSAVTKLIAKHRGEHLSGFKKKVVFQFLVVATICSSLFYISIPFVSNIANIPIQYGISLTVVLFLSFFSPISKGIYFGLDDPVKANILGLLESVIKIVLAFVSISMFRDSVDLPILASGLPFLLTGFLLMPFIGKRQENGNGDVREGVNLKDTFIYSLLFLFLTTPYTLDLTLINPDFRPQYSALSLVEKVVYYACISITGVMFSRIVNEKDEKKRRDTLWISLVLTVLVGVGISFGYLLFPNIIDTLILDGKYPDILKYLFIYGIGMTMYACTYLIYNYFIFLNYLKSIFWIFITTVLQIVLFAFRNDSLRDVIENQMILFTVLFVGSMVLLLSKIWTIPESNQ